MKKEPRTAKKRPPPPPRGGVATRSGHLYPAALMSTLDPDTVCRIPGCGVKYKDRATQGCT